MKNKEDPALSSSPTIVQKESTDGSQTGAGALSAAGSQQSSTCSPQVVPVSPNSSSSTTIVNPMIASFMVGQQQNQIMQQQQLLMNANIAPQISQPVAGAPLASGLFQASSVSAALNQLPATMASVVAATATSSAQNDPSISSTMPKWAANVGGNLQEIVHLEQALFESVRLIASSHSSAAASVCNQKTSSTDPSSSASASSGIVSPLPSVSTQHQIDNNNCPASNIIISSSLAGNHAPLNSSSTIRAATDSGIDVRSSTTLGHSTISTTSNILSLANNELAAKLKQQIIASTELLLEALNQGDYETYLRLCDPHMTSFEPEGSGLLIDNMQYRRLCLDQAYQMQLQYLRNQLIVQQQTQQTADKLSNLSITNLNSSCIAAVATAAATAAATALQQQANKSYDISKAMNVTQVVAAATSSALAQLRNMEPLPASSAAPKASSTEHVNVPTNTNFDHQQLSSISLANFNLTTSCASLKRYSVIVNPSVHLMGESAALIAYTRLDHHVNIQTHRLVQVEHIQETRVWNKIDANQWRCIHLHSSKQAPQDSASGSIVGDKQLNAGPQLNQALIRYMNNQQLEASTLAMQHELLFSSLQMMNQKQQQQLQAGAAKNVPIISLNHSSHGSGGGQINQHQHQQQNATTNQATNATSAPR